MPLNAIIMLDSWQCVLRFESDHKDFPLESNWPTYLSCRKFNLNLTIDSSFCTSNYGEGLLAFFINASYSMLSLRFKGF